MSKYIVDITIPPIPPPKRTFKNGFFSSKETQESIDQRRDWEDYMKEYKFRQDMTIIKNHESIKKINFNSAFYKNCKKNRKRESKICQDCPFREYIEIKENK